MKTVNLFEINFANVTNNEMIYFLSQAIKKNDHLFIQTVNVDHVVLSKKDNQFKRIIDSADVVTCDGMPIVWISKIKGKPILERVTGADLAVEICRLSSKFGFKVYLFGGGPNVADEAKKNIEILFPGAKVVGTYCPSNEELQSKKMSRKLCEDINYCKPNILLLALGAPKQEKWYWRNKEYIEANVTIGVGAAIDFLAGSKKRAPRWIRNAGFEWLFRLALEPKRMLKRYLVRDLKIIPLFIKELMK